MRERDREGDRCLLWSGMRTAHLCVIATILLIAEGDSSQKKEAFGFGMGGVSFLHSAWSGVFAQGGLK